MRGGQNGLALLGCLVAASARCWRGCRRSEDCRCSATRRSRRCLFGAVLLVPARHREGTGSRAAHASRGAGHRRGAASRKRRPSTLSLASIIVSFSLMVAMAIMVYSFRVSFDHWLAKLLPADLQMREPLGNDTAFWSPEDQGKLAAVPGVARAEFRRTAPGAARSTARAGDPDRPRPRRPRTPPPNCRCCKARAPAPANARPAAWISEALQDLYGYKARRSSWSTAGRTHAGFTVAGVWRDYARTSGAMVISRSAYSPATGDLTRQ